VSASGAHRERPAWRWSCGGADRRPTSAGGAGADRPPRPASRPARSTRRSDSWPRPRPARSTTSSAHEPRCSGVMSLRSWPTATTRPVAAASCETARTVRPGTRAQGVSDRLGCRGHGQPLRGAGVFFEICRAVRALPPLPADPHPLDLVLDGLALLTTDGRAAATPALQRAAKAVAHMPVEDVLRWGWLAGTASTATWDCDGARCSSREGC
jgi:hypothetical protein